MLSSRVLIFAACVAMASGCSNLLVSKGATADGSVIVTYNSDDMGLFGSLDLRPRATHKPGENRSIWDWDGQYYTGQIPEVPVTLNVVGNVNEVGVMLVETTFGGRSDCDGGGTGAIMSYGDLMFTTLTRATSAREAITIMDALMQTYGYESSGESFGVADSEEVWLMEVIGKGNHEPSHGSVWVASRVPDGSVGATANQARTTTFRQDDPANVLFSADVISFARSIGAYSGPDADFNFREAYDPISFSGCRFAEARVWNLFNEVCAECVAGHLDYAQGRNTSNAMPLFVPASKKLTFDDVKLAMRTHFEGTYFDNTGLVRPDVGAESGNSPYRFRPLTWASGGKTYLNERTVAVQQSGWAFIAVSRGWLPPPIRAVEWFAPDEVSALPFTLTLTPARRVCVGAKRATATHHPQPYDHDSTHLVAVVHVAAHPRLWRRDAHPALLWLARGPDAGRRRAVRSRRRRVHHVARLRLLDMEFGGQHRLL